MEKFLLLWHKVTPGGMIIGFEVEEIEGMDQLKAVVKRVNAENDKPENKEVQMIPHQIVVVK